ncbi:class I SAM-dependent methyltransferase [Alicyclobacillus sp. SO9]|uniref:class I SAM-dependent methyltransferase n=1 Tax=Alicyclobacillus sp. SO9 TaxID=2665646 RepID=UPI0018E6E5AC|nr:class I SAM-dependent methyltransferase [Alicyclobacillus sp. SO9]QQE77059.1 class I SAM-dependent methyltransferase [Alicyclobacillus sp. SO9]
MHERKFNPKNMHRLDSAERREKLPPEKLLSVLPMEKEHTVVDVGAGTGYFAIPVAQRVKRVIAVDVEPKMLEELDRKLQENKVSNVELVPGEAADIPLPAETADHVVASMILHEVEPLSAGLAEIYRVLKPGGSLFCLEWAKVETEQGPPLWHRIAANAMEEALSKAGFDVVYKEDPTEANYLIVAHKQ